MAHSRPCWQPKVYRENAPDNEEPMEQAAVSQKAPPHTVRDAALRQQLQSRREILRVAPPASTSDRLRALLEEVDAALERMDEGSYGICETCHDPIESDRLLLDPLCKNCLDHLSPAERRALEFDLDLAGEVQRGLLPDATAMLDGWNVAYSYVPAGAVSGDYCDLIACGAGSGYVLLGDITGKGIAASILMAQLHAIIRSLVPGIRSARELVTKANRIFCQGNLASYFATLVCGRITTGGTIEICNAGHCSPLVIAQGKVTRIESAGLPVGVFPEGDYGSQELHLGPGESLVLYSDGLSEAFNPAGEMFGVERLVNLLSQRSGLPPNDLMLSVLEEVKTFRVGAPKTDDLTMMVLRRER